MWLMVFVVARQDSIAMICNREAFASDAFEKLGLVNEFFA
jgi:hypothetical protein